MTTIDKVESLLRDTSEMIRGQRETQETGIKELLKSVAQLLAAQGKITKLKGEKFNVFRILKMEKKENKTHSPFIRELLDPKGSHFQDGKFLALFLKVIGHHVNTTEEFDTTSARVKKGEKYIGKVDDRKKTGGRIDIYIEDENKTSISIENKIDAGDQSSQIERYVNHNKKKNTVYYLTLFGSNPSQESRGPFTEGKDYFNISYRNEIIQWLKQCLKESAEQPILRETIKQYIVLIKELTSTMQDEYQKPLFGLIGENYEAAKYIADHIDDVEKEIRKEILDEVKRVLEAELQRDKYSLCRKKDETYEQIWIKLIRYEQKGVNLVAEIESKSKNLLVGIKAEKDIYEKVKNLRDLGDDDDNEEEGWAKIKYLINDKKEVELLYKQWSNKASKKEVVEKIAEQVKEYIEDRGPDLLAMFKSSKT